MKPILLSIFFTLYLFSLNASAQVDSKKSVETNMSVETHVFKVIGLTCPFCAIGIKKTFMRIEGVKSVEVSLQEGKVTVQANRGICFSEERLKELFEKTGFSYNGTIKKPKSCEKP